ncbi:MAG: hypothetical protein AABX54_05360 [Nanoarchaeota archaeon]
MAIRGDKMEEYMNDLVRRMGLTSSSQMFYLDQLWRAKFGGSTLPFKYSHPRDCHLLGLKVDTTLLEGGLMIVMTDHLEN